MNKDTFTSIIQRGTPAIETDCRGLREREAAEIRVGLTMQLITEACDASMPRRAQRNSRKPMYRWTPEISELRKICLHVRRRAQRLWRRQELPAYLEEYKVAKKELCKAIKPSKNAKWQAMIDDFDNDPWGLGYKVVMKKLGTLSSTSMDPQTMNEVVDTLFPDHPERNRINDIVNIDEISIFTEEELTTAVNSLKDKKAAGPDEISAEALKAVAKTCPHLLLDMYNECLKTGTFSDSWKVARLVLISKNKIGGNLASSFRSLCMLNTAGKVFEKLLQPRILDAVRAAGDLSDQQHGFRKGYCTLHAVRGTVETAVSA